MTDIKKSDRVLGILGILQSLIIIGISYLLVGMLIELQEDFNFMAEEAQDCDFLYGCTEEQEAELEEFVDFVQSKVIIWQALWAFSIFTGIALTVVAIRLANGANILATVLLPNENRRLFFYTLALICLFLFVIGYWEETITIEIAEKVNEMGDEETIDEEEYERSWTSNGFAVGYCHTAFLFIVCIIAFFTRDKPRTDESDIGVNMLNPEDDSLDIDNEDSLESAITSEGKSDEE